MDEENVNVAVAEIQPGQLKLASVHFEKVPEQPQAAVFPFWSSLNFEHPLVEYNLYRYSFIFSLCYIFLYITL